TVDRTIDSAGESCRVGCEPISNRAPPADCAAPEQLLPCLCTPDYCQILTADARCGCLRHRTDALPEARTLERGLVDLLVLLAVVLAPPVAEEILVGALADLNNGRSRIAHQLREEVQRDADVVGDGLVLQPHEQRQEVLHLLTIDD